MCQIMMIGQFTCIHGRRLWLGVVFVLELWLNSFVIGDSQDPVLEDVGIHSC